MKKLRIRKDADPKELEKHLVKLDILYNVGDEYLYKNTYCCMDEEDMNKYRTNPHAHAFEVEFYINEKREIAYCTYPECRSEEVILNKVYDLITAGLLVMEEVDEEN